MTRRHWTSDAACIGHGDIFLLPDRLTPSQQRRHTRSSNVAQAKAICHGCPVRAECRADVIAEPYPAPCLVVGGWLPWEVPTS